MAPQYHSAITRVRPFFQPLLRRDPSGASWLGSLLRLGYADPRRGGRLAENAGSLLEWVSRRTARPDRALRSFGIASVELEACFEYRLPPPERFLRWLIENPQAMAWPDDVAAEATQRRREELFGHHGLAKAQGARAEALGELRKVGAAGSNGKWWAFEGFTHVDCLLETETLLLLIEGKRTEPVSASTRWRPRRNQLLRNLEVARALAREKQKDYALILMAEEYIQGPSLEMMSDSLGHLPPRVQTELMDHYMGCVTWGQAMAELFLPRTVEEAAIWLRQEWKVPQIA